MVPKTAENRVFRVTEFWSYSDPLRIAPGAIVTVTPPHSSVTLYQCSHMAADCSKCLSLDPKWHCNWCDGGCKYHSRCSITPYADASSTTDQLCTQGVIESVRLASGGVLEL
jgi:hypothetical protein